MESWLFAGPAHLIALWPHAGIAVAVVLIAFQALLLRLRGEKFERNFFRQAPVFAGILWLIYGFYERQMMAISAAAAADANTRSLMRLDLIVVTPILAIFTGLAVWSLYTQLRKR